MRRVSVLVAVLLLLAATVGAPIAQARYAAADSHAAGRYIVTFADEPVASYAGYKAGFPATRPQAGKKLNPNSAAVRKWQKHLTAQARRGARQGRRDQDLRLHGHEQRRRRPADAPSRRRSSRAMKGVICLSKDQLAQPGHHLSPHFLGLDAAGGLWSQLGGAADAGAGVVVGVIDTGIWPESTAFAGGTGIPVPADWHGKCVAGEQFPVTRCNDKLIGARYYLDGLRQAQHRQGRLPLAARRRRPRLAHRVDGRRQPRDRRLHRRQGRSTTVPCSGHGAGRQGRRVQGLLDGQAGRPPTAASTPTASPRSTTRCSTASTSSTTRSAAPPSPTSSTRSRRPSAAPRTPVSSSPTRPATAAPARARSTIPPPWVTTVAAATFRRAFQAVELGNGARYVGASTTAVAADADAVRHVPQRQARDRDRRERQAAASPARSTRRRPPARSSSATAASSTGSTRASRSSAPAASAWS